MPLLLEKPVVYAVEGHDRRQIGPRSFEICGRTLHATLAGAEAARDEALATGDYDEVRVRSYRVEGREDPGEGLIALDDSVLYLVEARTGGLLEDLWFEMLGDALFASIDEAVAAQKAAVFTHGYEDVIILRYPVKAS